MFKLRNLGTYVKMTWICQVTSSSSLHFIGKNNLHNIQNNCSPLGWSDFYFFVKIGKKLPFTLKKQTQKYKYEI